MNQRNAAPITATLCHSSLPEGRAPSTARVTQNEVVVTYEGGRISFPLRDLVIRSGGANNKLILLSHPSLPGWEVFTTDRSILSALKSVSNSKVLQQVKQLGSQTRIGWIGAVVLLLGLLAAAYGVWHLRNPAIKYAASIIPASWERKIGELVYTAIKAEHRVVDDRTLEQELTELLRPLTDQLNASGYTFEFHISKDDDLNAFALPGGIVVVNRGSILKAASLDVLLGVLGHELSHVTLQHSTRQVITVFGLYVVVDFAFGNIFGTVAAISQGATYLLQQGFSRESEIEADNAGFDLLLKAGINPSGMIEFFKLVQKEHEESLPELLSNADKVLNFLSTHPDTDARIQYLAARIATLPKQRYIEMDNERFRRFQTRLRELS